MHKKEFWILTNKCGNNLKHENEAEWPWPPSLVFAFKIISTFIGQNPKFFYANIYVAYCCWCCYWFGFLSVSSQCMYFGRVHSIVPKTNWLQCIIYWYGLAPLLGLVTQTIGIPLLGFLAEKFRARKLFLFLSVFISTPSTLLFLAAKKPEPTCDESKGNSTMRNSTIALLLNVTDNFTELQSASHSNTQSENDGKWLNFFLIFMVLRGIFELANRLAVTLITVSAMTHLKQDRSKFGYYASWGEIGGGIALFIVGISLYRFQHQGPVVQKKVSLTLG